MARVLAQPAAGAAAGGLHSWSSMLRSSRPGGGRPAPPYLHPHLAPCEDKAAHHFTVKDPWAEAYRDT